ncbi:MAG TPA: LysR family transcriptional regulator [Devosiaceae bacterium]|jgi:DNA-binding transcriptional LysR family regulator|nr:LysR family transcriptional regulator [Devosiaceae bacterium]
MAEPDWSLWRSFAAVVAEGSLSAAARRLGLSQPTLGRHVEALERALDVTLFERTMQGLRPTDTALRLYEPVAAAQRALAEAAIVADSTGTTLSGTIRITASTVTAHHVLPPLLGELRVEFPQMAIELVPSDTAENLLLREADIAVRMFRPTQLELVTRRLGAMPVVACAHERYVERRGAPQRPEDLLTHDLIGFDRSDLLLSAARGMGFELNRGSFMTRTDSQTAMWELLKAGLGVGFAQQGLVLETPGMVPLLPELRPPPLEIWLTTHRELFTSRRIRVIYDRLAAGLTAYLDRVAALAATEGTT